MWKNKQNKVVTEENYKQIILKRAIILSWVFLGIAFIIKLFGGNFFNLFCDNEHFIAICDYIDNTFLYYPVAFVFYFVSTFIFYYTISCVGHLTKTNAIILSVTIILSFIIKCINSTVGMVFEYTTYFVVNFIVCKLSHKSTKNAIIMILLGFVLNNIFQLISLFVKNIGLFKVVSNDTLTQTILSIDYYIMLLLYMFYVKEINLKKGD